MEKTWDEFWTSGKVTDYLAYRNVVADQKETQGKQQEHGAAGDRDGHGFECNAH